MKAILGLLLMAIGIVMYFGWAGAVFSLGLGLFFWGAAQMQGI